MPAWLAAIVDKLLAKSPAERFQTAAEVAELLGQWLAHLAQPTVILPPKFVVATAEKPSRRAKWQPWSVGVAVASMVLVGGLLGVGLNELLQVGSDRRAEPGAASGSPDCKSGHRRSGPAAQSRRAINVQGEFRAADEAFAVELDRAQQQTALLEAEAFDAPAGVPVSLRTGGSGRAQHCDRHCEAGQFAASPAYHRPHR